MGAVPQEPLPTTESLTVLELSRPGWLAIEAQGVACLSFSSLGIYTTPNGF